MEQCWALLYMVPGLTDTGLERKTRRERMWLLRRLNKQKQDELKEIERAQTQAEAKARAVRKR